MHGANTATLWRKCALRGCRDLKKNQSIPGLCVGETRSAWSNNQSVSKRGKNTGRIPLPVFILNKSGFFITPITPQAGPLISPQAANQTRQPAGPFFSSTDGFITAERRQSTIRLVACKKIHIDHRWQRYRFWLNPSDNPAGDLFKRFVRGRIQTICGLDSLLTDRLPGRVHGTASGQTGRKPCRRNSRR